MVIETERLYLKELEQSNFTDLCKIMQDIEAMKTTYENAFTDEEVQGWLDRQTARYRNDGFGLYAVILKETGEMIGQCGLTKQPWKDETLLEIGYLFQRAFWHNGYATEAAIGYKKYAFEVLGAEKVYSIVRDTNIPSQNVALRNGMTKIDESIKHFRGVDMLNYLYSVSRDN